MLFSENRMSTKQKFGSFAWRYLHLKSRLIFFKLFAGFSSSALALKLSKLSIFRHDCKEIVENRLLFSPYVWVLKCMGVLVICTLYSDWGFSYPDWGFFPPCFFLSCKAKCQGKTRKDGALSALLQFSCCLCCSVVIFAVLYTVCV